MLFLILHSGDNGTQYELHEKINNLDTSTNIMRLRMAVVWDGGGRTDIFVTPLNHVLFLNTPVRDFTRFTVTSGHPTRHVAALDSKFLINGEFKLVGTYRNGFSRQVAAKTDYTVLHLHNSIIEANDMCIHVCMNWINTNICSTIVNVHPNMWYSNLNTAARVASWRILICLKLAPLHAATRPVRVMAACVREHDGPIRSLACGSPTK